MDRDIVKRFICGAKEAYKKVDDHSFNFPITIESAYRLATNIEKLLKEQEAVKPEVDYVCGNIVNVCGKCKSNLIARVKFCPWCGKEVKWK